MRSIGGPYVCRAIIVLSGSRSRFASQLGSQTTSSDVPGRDAVERERPSRVGHREVRVIRDEEIGPSPVQTGSARQFDPSAFESVRVTG